MPERRRYGHAERDEGEIGHEEVDRLRKIEALSRVDALHHDDARVVAKTPVELPLAHVDGIDADGAALQQHVGEPAGRRAEVEGDPSPGTETQVVERGRELFSASRGVPRTLVHGHVGLGFEEGRGAIRSLSAYSDLPREDHCLGPLAAGRKAALHQQLIETCASRHRPRIASTRAAIRDARLRRMPKRMPRSRTLKGDPKLVYYDSGGGVAGEPPLVLLHGVTLRAEDWENIFPRLATRYRVIAYDARGHGKSGRAEKYGPGDFADDLVRVLRELAQRPAILVGHSLGAQTALIVADRDPALVRGVVLEDPPLGPMTDARRAYLDAIAAALAEKDDPKAFRSAVARIPLMDRGPRGERTIGEVRGFYSPERMTTYFSALDPHVIERRPTPDADGRAALDNARPSCPALVLVADQKVGGMLNEDGVARLQALPDAKVMRFPGVGHRIHGLRPEPFLEALEPFLRRVRTAS